MTWMKMYFESVGKSVQISVDKFLKLEWLKSCLLWNLKCRVQKNHLYLQENTSNFEVFLKNGDP